MISDSGQRYAREAGLQRIALAKDSIITEAKTKRTTVECLVCLTQVRWEGFDGFYDDKAFLVSKHTFTQRDSNIIKYALEFDKDIERLHPLSKLKGIGVNKESSSKLPNLDMTTEDYAEDLIMAIKEILEPGEDVKNCSSWCKSHLRILAVSQMILHLKKLG